MPAPATVYGVNAISCPAAVTAGLRMHLSMDRRRGNSRSLRRVLRCGVWIAGCALFGLSSGLLFAADFPVPFNTGENAVPPPVSSAGALDALRLPDGFSATVFAAEPDVQNPIAMAWDARGRLWVAENYTYGDRTTRFDLRLRDRLLVFEDRNGDGRFSSRRVFIDDVQHLGSVEVGHGGVWLMCPPQLLFVPDRDSDGAPDGPPQVVLDGFTIPWVNYHTFANGLRFGPDGWLYGRVGSASPAEVGAPGTPAADRVPLRGTVWRYHPQRKVVEALGSGTTNPWGHDWDKHGELFFINTVNGHLWHGTPGAHFRRAHTVDPNPHVYELIDQHADHWHFDTAFDWTKSRDGAANDFGGGHAHAGLMIYQGDNWPAAYRNQLYTLNFHGRRANRENLVRHGSGYVGRHAPDFFLSDDPWFRGIDVMSGPDGGVFVLDWSDMGECHNASGVNRTSGRIFKIAYGPPPPPLSLDLTRATPTELVALQTHANDWWARQARLQLATRAAAGQSLTEASERARTLFSGSSDGVVQLRALWALHGIGGADAALLRAHLYHENEHVRTWAVRLLTDAWPLDTVMSSRPRPDSGIPDPEALHALITVARTDRSGLVRLALASALQRLPVGQRAGLAGALMSRPEDAADHNLPLMIWYGLIPLGAENPRALAELGARCELPTTRKLIARRLTEEIERTPAPLDTLISAAVKQGTAFQADILRGIAEGLLGWRRAPKPATWDALAEKISAHDDLALRNHVRDLSLLFGDGRALADIKALVLNTKADLATRQVALRSLIESRAPDLREICLQVLRVRYLNTVAVRGLALSSDPAIAESIVAAFSSFHPTDHDTVIETLVSRPEFAKILLTQIGAGRIPRARITAFHARQIRGFNDEALSRQLTDVWGETRESNADLSASITRLKQALTPSVLEQADRSRGRALFAGLCAACHRLYGQGGDIGPDLTGAGRDNLDYLLLNIIDPSAVVTADFRMAVVKLHDGRTLNGFIAARTARTVTLRTTSETLTLERSEVRTMEPSAESIMPQGLLEALPFEQQRDLIAYLMHLVQVPLP